MSTGENISFRRTAPARRRCGRNAMHLTRSQRCAWCLHEPERCHTGGRNYLICGKNVPFMQFDDAAAIGEPQSTPLVIVAIGANTYETLKDEVMQRWRQTRAFVFDH
jgi:hypothetical protein